MKTLIIGGVAGGASAAARLRRLDESMEIVILERGDYISYANCGLPYYVGDVIQDRAALLLQTPEMMNARFNVDVRIKNEALKINKDKKTVTVRGPQGEYEESYDELIIATGSSPIRPPIPGIDGDGIYSLWTVNDVDKIRRIVDREQPKTAAVIGGGFIGLEMAENLHARGIKVALIEAMNQVMAPVDYEMAKLLHENMDMNGVALFLDNGVDHFERKGNQTEITLAKGDKVLADMVILSIGVRPNSELAVEAGIEVNQRKGIVVDKMMRTSEPHIWAVGDVVEIDHLISGERTMIPLAGPANKQGRIVADNICGANKEYSGSMGTSVAQVFDLTVAATGLNEKALKAKGLEKHKDYETVLINQKSHAGYYPMATQMYLKLIFEKGGKILGAQIVGQDGVDKRIDTIATTIANGGSVEMLKELELAYAPPYSSAKDPVNMLGFTAENVLDGRVQFVSYDELDGKVVVDVRENIERMASEFPGAVNISLGELRKRLDEVPKDKELVVNCAIGVRSYNGARILMQNGFERVYVLEGGSSFYQSMQYEPKTKWGEADGGNGNIGVSGNGNANANGNINRNAVNAASETIQILNCCGLQCPGPIMKVNEALSRMNDGEVLKVSATDMGFSRDVESWCCRTGNTYIGVEKNGKEHIVTLMKGVNQGAAEAEFGAKVRDGVNANSENNAVNVVASGQDNQNKTIIVFDGDMDKVMASLIIANGAAAMGRKVTMFYTFWGLNALRKSNNVSVKKTFIEKMFGSMMPRGLSKLALSKMNMLGMGKAMMKYVMRQKNVTSLEELMQSAMRNGVKMIACTMSMDVMGIKEEELIDGVELAGVATYLGDAELSNVNLFI
ncbi:MAG: DsrE/DsrF/DrsH-like family protein [Firmicutes bacterium]|nr:DsrE/DsrF/DrsH-like family protein [Bacillota bacterium]